MLYSTLHITYTYSFISLTYTDICETILTIKVMNLSCPSFPKFSLVPFLFHPSYFTWSQAESWAITYLELHINRIMQCTLKHIFSLVLSRFSCMILNGSGESRYLCLVVDLGRKAFSLSPLAVNFFHT